MSRKKISNQQVRLLRFLQSVTSARHAPFGPVEDGRLIFEAVSNPRQRHLSTRQCFEHALKSDLLMTAAAGDLCSLTPAGISRLKRLQHNDPEASPFQAQHRNVVQQEIKLNGERHKVSRNLNESPLSRLRTRSDKRGQPWLSAEQFSAGERLRQDFTYAQLAGHTRTNWRDTDQTISGGGRGAAGGHTELSDSALDARRRFNQALDFVGPDLACVLTDVCCYLKGLQMVERDLQWPPRSAKLMLRAGLGLLAQFYGTHAGKRPAGAASDQRICFR